MDRKPIVGVRILNDRGIVSGDLTETVSRTGAAATDSSVDDGAPRLIVICECSRLTVPALRVALGDLQEVTVGRELRRGLARHGRTAMLSVPDNEISRKPTHPSKSLGAQSTIIFDRSMSTLIGSVSPC